MFVVEQQRRPLILVLDALQFLSAKNAERDAIMRLCIPELLEILSCCAPHLTAYNY